ncbi:cyclopropane-fatty-acyl-phospholipid synthase family protein [Nitrospinae bacterium]|nr:cyclopropane-fatty-acyl-phospholipid synthase family protein [Nitrospinota bacterium]
MQINELIDTKPIEFFEKPLILDKLARKIILSHFNRIKEGEITVIENSANITFGETTANFPVKARIEVQNPRMYLDIVAKGLNGSADAFIKGWWTCDNLTNLVRIFTRNRDAANQFESGIANLAIWIMKLSHSCRRNNLKESLRNIHAHYDLGNDFFSTFLDDTRMYSCAIFSKPESSLHEASITKIDRICKKLNLSPADHLLEIGTGWGGFALHAAKHYGCRITSTTISKEQFVFTETLIKENGLQDQVTILKKDFRQLDGQFDKLVSIEMIEAVGYKLYKTFFQKCSQLLKPEGLLVIQAITITDNLFEESKDFIDFIKQYIFPGSCIPSITALCNAATSSDIKLFHLEDITPHYARTLKEWRINFLKNNKQVKALGFTNAFIRMWLFYLCYCEGGFIERQIGNVQMVFTKPLCRRDPIIPALETVI